MSLTDHHREAWVARAREGDLMANALRYAATLKRAGREYTGPCPWCGGTDRFSINPVKAKWHCRGHGGGGDAIGMVMHIAGLSFLEAVQDITGEPPPSGDLKPLTEHQKAARNRQRQEAESRQQALKARQSVQEENSREFAQGIWDGSVPIAGTLAEAYLRSRGIVLDQYPDVLRFHGALPYPKQPKTYPVLVCRIDDVLGQFTAIWRIFLRADGRKADVENPKLGLGPSAGGAVRLNGMGAHIGIAEGVETALGAWLLTGRKIPVWSGLSTAGVVGLEVPLGVNRITVFPDGDAPIKRHEGDYIATIPPGRKAAQSLFARLTEEGIRASVAAEPPAGKDYNDLWLEQMRDVA